jgi:tetratricopeptide (TPR) repeat protein
MNLAQNEARHRFDRLSDYLAADPANARLAVECAEAALAADLPDRALKVLGELGKSCELDETITNLAGIAAMRAGDHASAQARFESLLARRPDDSSLRFNLAWSRALAGDFEKAGDALDQATIESLPQAAMLDLQIDHHLGKFEQAREKLPRYLERYADYEPLQAAASVLAIDLEDVELARVCATKAPDHPDAMTTLGSLDLAENRLEAAREWFERSIAINAANPRAQVGIGLTELAGGHPAGAAEHLDRGAELFGDHLGSWIAAGWAHYLAGDPAAARARFETALALDGTFGEAHGSLAALDALEGNLASAERRTQVARRLDRNSFSAALADMLLAAEEGEADKARKIFEFAASQPLTHDRKTLVQALAELSR